MVDDCPPTLLPHHPLLSASPPPELHGVAALAPQFDRAISTPRRSVPPIGSLSPQSRSFGTAPTGHHVPPHLHPQHQHNHHHHQQDHHHPQHPHPQPPAQKLPLASSPSIPAADFLAECTLAADRVTYPHSAPPRQHDHPPLEYDLFGLSSLDLGPPVLHSRFPPPSPSPPPAPQQQQQQQHAPLEHSPLGHPLLSPTLGARPIAPPCSPPATAPSFFLGAHPHANVQHQPPHLRLQQSQQQIQQQLQPQQPLHLQLQRQPQPQTLGLGPSQQQPQSQPLQTQPQQAPLSAQPQLQPQQQPQPRTPPLQAAQEPPPQAQAQQPPQLQTASASNSPQDQPISPSRPVTTPSATTPTRPREPAHPTRSVLLRNIPPGIDDEDIRTLLTQFGPLRDLGAQHRARGGRGSVLATYYDLRHARAAVRALDSTVQFGRRLDARFQQTIDTPAGNAAAAAASNGTAAASATSSSSSSSSSSTAAENPSQNHGTLVVFNLDLSTSAEDVRALFSSVGDVKEIRATPNKKHHKFVEFYDVRDAERAMLLLNKTEVAGKRIKIEISRPGGRASCQARAAQPAAHQQQSQQQQGTPAKQGVAIPSYLPSEALGGSHRRVTREITSTSGNFTPSSYPPPSFAQHIPSAPQIDSTTTSRFETPVEENKTTGSAPVPVPVPNGRNGLCSPPSSTVFSFEDKGAMRSPPSEALLSPFIARPVVQPLRTLSQQPQSKHPPDSYIQALYNSPPPESRRVGLAVSPKGVVASPPKRQGGATEGNGPNRGNGDGGSPRGPGGRHGHGHGHSRQNQGGSPQNGAKSTNGGTQQHGHGNNSKFLLDIRKVRSGEETRTALMIRNIPNKYNQKMLLSTLEEGHKGHFDFIYLPIDFKNKCNVGYAFINFTKPELIEAFYHEFHGKKWGRFNSEKVCEITFARIQGRQQLIAHFQNSSLLLEDPKCRPVIFDSKGRQEEFPVGSHVRTRRGPSNRDGAHRGCDSSPPFSPPKHRGRA